MECLDFARLEAEDPRAFWKIRPYPWLNPTGYLHDAAYRALLASLPGVAQMEERFGEVRKFGQQSHDRLALDYAEDLDLSPVWHAFVAELKSERYRRYLRRMLRVPEVVLHFHWHYTPPGASVSPHCDAKRKLASHIFYFNDETSWREEWGGETLILDDGGRLSRRSAPAFSDFDSRTRSMGVGNRSLLFARTAHAWHGVEALRCPEGQFRRVFIVVADRAPWAARTRARLGLRARL